MAVRGERGPAALSPLRRVALTIGFLCAISATVMIFVTENAQYLRIGILVALWGFVFAALAAGRRQAEQALAASSEIELRKGYELELGREVTARREYELRLEAQLRREVHDTFTTQIGGLRDELVRLREELSEQWDSELRVERMVMRTQSVRMGADRRGALELGQPEPTAIDAGSSEAEPWNGNSSDAQPWGPASSEAEPWSPGSSDAQPWTDARYDDVDGPDQASAAQRPDEAWLDDLRDDAGPPTIEAPVYAVPPSVPTAPVPTLPFAGATATTSFPPAVEPHSEVATDSSRGYGAAGSTSSDDVLTRVLAEAGADPASRRRKHRYADEGGDSVRSRY